VSGLDRLNSLTNVQFTQDFGLGRVRFRQISLQCFCYLVFVSFTRWIKKIVLHT